MAIRIVANTQSIFFPPRLTPPIEIVASDVELVVNSTRVGLKVANESIKADIELVQFYLSEFFELMPAGDIPNDFPFSKTGEMVKIDGFLGKQTNAAILLYQKQVLHLLGDGIVTAPAIAPGPFDVTRGHNVTIASFTNARTILTLGVMWKQFHQDMDILDSEKLKTANHLKASLR